MSKIFGLAYLPEKTIINLLKIHLSMMFFVAFVITFILNDVEDFEGRIIHESTIDNFIESLYFSGVTLSSTGYGDIHPKSPRARFFIMLISIYIALACIYV